VGGGCSTGGADGRETAPETAAAIGPGYPDPRAVLKRVFDAMEERDFAGMCAHLAGLGRNGRPVPLVPGRNLPEVPPDRPDLWPRADEVRGFQQFLDAPWKTVSYGRPRNLLNDPPTISVPVRVRYHWDRMPAKERELLARAWSKELGRSVSWDEVFPLMSERNRASPAPLLFTNLGGHWRLYLGPPPRS